MGAFCPFLARRPATQRSLEAYLATAFQPRIAPEPPAASSHYIKPESLHKLNMLTLDTNEINQIIDEICYTNYRTVIDRLRKGRVARWGLYHYK
jgi:hypothetical protein